MFYRVNVLILSLYAISVASAQRLAMDKYDVNKKNGEFVFSAQSKKRIENDFVKLKDCVLTVADDTMTVDGADSHDYMSPAPYWFDNGNGEWIRKDGERNPDVEKWKDKKDLNRLVREINLLSLAERMYDREGDALLADSAVARMEKRLYWWFVDNKTKMNPNMKYAQFIPKDNKGVKTRNSGLIESRGLMDVIECIELVDSDGRMDSVLKKKVQKWFGEMVKWMASSEQGKHEREAKNNHGTWYAAQIMMYSQFCGNDSLLEGLIPELKVRILDQIDDEGRQKYEMERTKSLSYCCFNILAYMYCKDALNKFGVNVENWKEWSRVNSAIEYLKPYTEEGNKWPLEQIKPFDDSEWGRIFR